MPEVTYPGEHHGEPELVGGGDDFFVFHRSARLYDRGGPGLGDNLQAVREGKESI